MWNFKMVCGQPSGIKSVEFQNGLCPSTNQMTCGRARAKNTKMMQNRRVINTQCRGEHTNVRETTTYYDSIQLADFRKMLLYAVWLFFQVLFILMVVESTFFFFQRGVTKTSWFCSYLFARPKPLYVGKLTTRCNTAKKIRSTNSHTSDSDLCDISF